MDEPLVRFGVVLPPILLALGQVAFGAIQAGLALRRRSFLRLAWGGSLAVAGMACLAGALVYALDRRPFGGIALLWILAAWLLPVVVIPAAALVLGSVVTLLGALRRRSLAARGFVQLPGALAGWAAAAILLGALGIFAHTVVVPAWQLWPYRELAASGELDSITLVGMRGSVDGWRMQPISVIRWQEASPWRAEFRLTLDSRGRIVVTTYRPSDALSRREQRLPFEDSEYVLRDGVLERTR